MQNDTSSRKDCNHIERKRTIDVKKKRKYIQEKGTISTLFGVENNLAGESHACTIMAGNNIGRSGKKYKTEVLWKTLLLL